MNIQDNHVITLSLELRLSDGETITDGEETVEYLHGGYDNIFPKLEEALQTKSVGDFVELALDPEDAFGDYDSDLIRVEERALFPDELQVGMSFEGVPESLEHEAEDSTEDIAEDEENINDDEALIYTVTDIADGKVVLDANHPFAGERIWVRAKVQAARAASEEEIEHGHVHGAHGVSHGESSKDDTVH
jgi:FKBP-type peptidyl-prolyl cis-trans isomerase SlyD